MPEKLQIEMVLLLLARANLRLHPSARYQPGELEDLAQGMIEDLGDDLDAVEFRAAMIECRRTNSFVPTAADILHAHERVLEAHPRPRLSPTEMLAAEWRAMSEEMRVDLARHYEGVMSAEEKEFYLSPKMGVLT